MVRVDLDALTEAFEDASAELSYFVDRVTGEVILVSDTLGFIEAGLQRAEMAEEPDRYVPVPVSGLDELIEDLEAFIDGLGDEAIQDALEQTLDTADPKSALNANVAKHEEIARAWRRHRTAQFRGRAAEWLNQNGFSPA